MTERALSDRKDFKGGCLIAFINHHLQIGKSFRLVHTILFLLMPKNSPADCCEPGYELVQTERERASLQSPAPLHEAAEPPCTATATQVWGHALLPQGPLT